MHLLFAVMLPNLHPKRSLAIAGALFSGLYLGLAVWTDLRVNSVGFFASDFGIYLAATRRVLAGSSAYYPVEIGRSFVYPPPALLLFSPFVALGDAAPLVWALLTVAAYLLAIYLLWRVGSPERSLPKLFALLGLFAAYTPFIETVRVGQINSLVLLGITLLIVSYVRPRKGWGWAGDLGLVFAILIKITPAMLLAVPVLHRDWRRCLRLLAGGVGLSLLPLFVYGPAPWADFISVLPTLFAGQRSPFNMALASTLSYTFGDTILPWTLAQLVGGAFSVGLILLWLWVVWRSRSGRYDVPGVLALGVVVMTLSSSLLWYHHLVFLVLPVSYILLRQHLSAKELWLVLVAVLLIQSDRFVQAASGIPPLPSVAGYLLVLVLVATLTLREQQPVQAVRQGVA
jgi:Glycosyltransferase family 87